MKLYVTPTVRVSDVAGNSVSAFATPPIVTCKVVPWCSIGDAQSQDDFDFGTGCASGTAVPEALLTLGESEYGPLFGPLCTGTPPQGVKPSSKTLNP